MCVPGSCVTLGRLVALSLDGERVDEDRASSRFASSSVCRIELIS
jgi:hypothetical protein